MKKLIIAGVAAAIGIAVLSAVLIFFLLMSSRHEKPAAALPAIKEEKAFEQLTPTEHLEKCRSLESQAMLTLIEDCRQHLRAIGKEAGEYKEAAALLKIADDKEKAILIETMPLEIVKSNWTKEAFGTIAEWTVTFKNRSSKPVGNIQYRTVYSSETGNVVDKGGVDSVLGASGKTIQKVIPPKGTRTLEINDGFVNKEAHSAAFELVAWEFVVDQR